MVDLVRDKLDSEKSKTGVWKDIDGFARVKLRRWNNAEYRDEALKLRDAKLEELNLKPTAELSDEISREIMIRAACKHVIVDWEGVEVDGKAVPYDPVLAIDAFTDSDDSWHDEFNMILSAASDRANYVRERKEENRKKS